MVNIGNQLKYRARKPRAKGRRGKCEVRKYRHYGGAPIGKRRLESSNIGQKSEDWKNQLVSLNSKLKLINAGLDLLIRLLKYLLQITQK